jgi:3-oxoacyl-[acyl-carrier protein] reductase
MLNVVVTGGSRGLGLGISRRLAAAGYRAIAVARKENPELTSAMAEAEAARSSSFHFIPYDLANTDGIAELVKALRKEFGPLYGLVNNAGISFEGVLALMRDSEVEQLFRVNAVAPIILAKYAVRAMMADGGGRIVNISSVAGFAGYNGLAAYGATKASLIGFTRSLAREVGKAGINVNAVAPGFIDTDMTSSLSEEQRDRIVRRSALRRLASVEDVADAVEFLLSERAKNITGTVLTVDAGGTA